MPCRHRQWEEQQAVVEELENGKMLRGRYGKEWYDAEVVDTNTKDGRVKVQWQAPFHKEDPQWLPITDCMVTVLVKSALHEDDSSSTEEDDEMRDSNLIGFIRSMRKNSRAQDSVPERLRWAITNHVKPIKVRRLVKLTWQAGMIDAAIDADGSTALHHACIVGNCKAISLIFERGGNPHVQNDRGCTPLHFAASHGHTLAVNALIEAGVALEAVNAHGRTALHAAVLRGRETECAFLLANGSLIGAVDTQGCTSLHLAARCGNTDVIQLLVDTKADLFATDKKGKIPMHLAAEAGHTRAVDKLCSLSTPEQAQAQVDARSSQGATPLHLACRSANLDTVKYFIEKLERAHQATVQLQVKDKDLLSPLHYALREGAQAVVEYLLFVGVNTKVLDIMLAQGIANATAFKSIKTVEDEYSSD